MQMTIAQQSASLANGARLEYVERGDPTGVPVVFLHGYSDSWHSFELNLPYLPTSVRALALTQRGHGDSDRPATGYALSDYVADVEAFLDALGIERAVIVGHSMGTFVALRFAIRHPERTLGLVLLGALASIPDKPVMVELREAVSSFTDPVDLEFIREFQESTVSRPVPADFLATVIAESQKLPARVWQATCEGWFTEDDEPEFEAIRAPTLLLWGDQDPYGTRADQDLLGERIPDAQLLVYEGIGHALHWQEAARVAADITAHAHAMRLPASAGSSM
jgi:pimeloyl-ACP methyl ester carboxylesterase